MKKLLIAVAIALAIAFLIFLAFGLSVQNKASIGIIGGADGPTAILVTGSLFASLVPVALLALLVAVIVAIILYKKGI